MKPRLLSLLPALAISAAGVVLLCHQRAEVAAHRHNAPRVVPLRKEPLSASRQAAPNLPAPAAVTAALTTGEQRAAAFLAGLTDKAQPLLEKSEREAALNRARFAAERAALLSGLSAEEKAELQQHLEKQPGPNAAHEWIAAHCRAEQLAAFEAAETARRTASDEHEAQEAIFRLSRMVDLTPEQKDRLYTGFVSKAAAAPASEATPMELRTSFTVTDTPRITDPGALARPLLAPEQLAIFNAAVAQETKVIRESSEGVMGQLMPVLMSALHEAAAEQE